MSVCEVLNAALSDIAAERQRQIEGEGWTPDHDDQHVRGAMAKAAACYAVGSQTVGWAIPGDRRDFIKAWPWASKWWKPTDPRRNLVKAGALIVAEIERLDRQAARKAAEQSQEPGADEDHGSGPYTCCRCTAGTWNDDDWCDDCRAEAAEQSREGGES